MNPLKAYAKINLGLRIIGKRADGYHDIETILHRVDIFDELSFEPSPTLALESASPDVPPGEENLCLKAARLLQARSGTRAGARISLKKKIPVGAGLGGGSSDAAATLLGLNDLWNLRMKPDELLPLAAQLGSDVPYFLRDGTAYATGRGELLEYFTFTLPYWVVVCFPGIHVSTAWAYNNITVQPSPARNTLKDDLTANLRDRKNLHNVIVNDFEPVVFRSHPTLAAMKQSCYDHGALLAAMSGSGSAIYGLFESEREARSAGEALGGSARIFLTPPGVAA